MTFRSSHASKIQGQLILAVTVLSLLRHLASALPDLVGPELQWQVSDTLRAATAAAALGLCVSLVPWGQLRIKCVCAALCGYFVADTTLCVAWYLWRVPSPEIAAAAQGLAFFGAAAFYWRRSYTRPSAPLELGYLFCVRHIPTGPQDFLISLAVFFGPDGGLSLYADGYLYKFANGRLVRRKVTALPSISYHVIRGSRTTPEIIGELDSMIGMRWTWRKNCLTTLAPIWRKHRG